MSLLSSTSCIGMPRDLASEIFASSYRPLAVSHLGDSGIVRIPNPRMIGQRIPKPTTVRQEPDPEMERVPIEKQSMNTQKRQLD